jgi:hypothetical protein
MNANGQHPYFREIIAQAQRDGLWALPGCADPSEKHPCVEWADWDGQPSEEKNAEWLESYPHRNEIYLTGRAPRRLGRFVLDGHA